MCPACGTRYAPQRGFLCARMAGTFVLAIRRALAGRCTFVPAAHLIVMDKSTSYVMRYHTCYERVDAWNVQAPQSHTTGTCQAERSVVKERKRKRETAYHDIAQAWLVPLAYLHFEPELCRSC